MSDTVKLLDILSDKTSIYRRYAYSPPNSEPKISCLTRSDAGRIKSSISSSRFKDDYNIEHGLSEDDIRIIFKIMAKDYLDAGRKRGAILRYINYYKEMEANETNTNVDLFRKLNQIALKNQ
tara:strand:- start:207 stop:572 length:366 start_codon:yes stop_codon:yes gene_type:complete